MQVKHFPRSKIACLDFRSGFVLRLSTFKPNSFADFYIRKAGVSEELLIVNSLRTASFVSREKIFFAYHGNRLRFLSETVSRRDNRFFAQNSRIGNFQSA